MKYHIKFNNGNDEFLFNDSAFCDFIQVAVMHNKDITDFHVKIYRNEIPLYKTEYNGQVHYYTFEDFMKFFKHEGGQYPDLKMELV